MIEDSDILTDWVEIPITSRAKCSECGNEIMPGLALWSKSASLIKHLTCKREKYLMNESPTKSKSFTADLSRSSGIDWVRKQETNELKCFICGRLAGCQGCMFTNSCDREIVSQSCICEDCMSEMLKNGLTPLDRYQKAFLKKAKITN